MAPKKNNKGRRQRSKTPGRTSASDPNPIATSPSASAPSGDATTASLVPSSASPSTPPTTTTTDTQLIPSAPPQTTALLPSSPSHLTATTQPLSSAPPLPIRKTHQEPISCSSDGATTTDLAGPSTAPSASAASTDDFFLSLFATAVEGAMAALQIAKEEDPAELQGMVANSFGLRLDDVESILDCFLGLAEHMKGDAQLKAALEAFGNVEALKSTVKVAGMMLAERKKRDGSGGSCGGSKGDGGGPDSGSGEGDGEGGGVSV
ncbi:mucin-2-like [Cocos nucifera]|uniref:Mucin-2-like n=1 Tax=Cocos nucifera TaxID=13894 RepID=A0A8K0IJV6_COCNU|nr:mucin-2-like [Cocos nucifera]